MSKPTKTNHYGVKDITVQGIAVKDVDMNGRTVTGMYNTYNFLDVYGDVLLPGCAKRTIGGMGPKSKAVAKIKHALHHDLRQLPGKIKVLEEKNVDGYDGIYFETEMIDTQIGNDTLKNYEAGIYDNHSIGFQYKVVEMVERDTKAFDKIVGQLVNPEAAEGRSYIWAVKEIALWEGSTVAFGANSQTPCYGMKSQTPEERISAANVMIDRIAKALRSGSQSDEALQILELEAMQLKEMVADLIERQMPEDIEAERKKIAVVGKTGAPISVDDVKNLFGAK